MRFCMRAVLGEEATMSHRQSLGSIRDADAPKTSNKDHFLPSHQRSRASVRQTWPLQLYCGRNVLKLALDGIFYAMLFLDRRL